MEYRIWQNNLTMLQMYEKTSLPGLGEKLADLNNFGSKWWLEDQRKKGSVHKHSILVDKVSPGGMG